MKKQKIKREGFYGEAIFNIAAYNCNRNYVIGGYNSERALSSMLAITNYLHNLPETSTIVLKQSESETQQKTIMVLAVLLFLKSLQKTL